VSWLKNIELRAEQNLGQMLIGILGIFRNNGIKVLGNFNFSQDFLIYQIKSTMHKYQFMSTSNKPSNLQF
jgi:hypothetical protein